MTHYFRFLLVKMETNIKAVMAEATKVDAELTGSSNICGMVVVDNRGLCIAAEVNCIMYSHIMSSCTLCRVMVILLVLGLSSL